MEDPVFLELAFFNRQQHLKHLLSLCTYLVTWHSSRKWNFIPSLFLCVWSEWNYLLHHVLHITIVHPSRVFDTDHHGLVLCTSELLIDYRMIMFKRSAPSNCLLVRKLALIFINYWTYGSVIDCLSCDHTVIDDEKQANEEVSTWNVPADIPPALLPALSSISNLLSCLPLSCFLGILFFSCTNMNWAEIMFVLLLVLFPGILIDAFSLLLLN